MPAVYGQVTISWNRNVEADLAGYYVLYGTDGINFPFAVNVGLTATPLTPSVTLTSFNAYGTLYFAVTAYDNANNISAPSSPSVNIAVAPKLMPLVWP